MIVDLLRNDLSMVCEPGHGRGAGADGGRVLRDRAPARLDRPRPAARRTSRTVGALRALFPAGSMTGAPKLRTMQIIDEVEDTPRGVYAGAFGWIAADGRADLGVVIRSLMTAGDGRYDLGTGGGITVRSDVEEEYAESRWKAERLLAALVRQLFGGFPASTSFASLIGDPLGALEVVRRRGPTAWVTKSLLERTTVTRSVLGSRGRPPRRRRR